MLKINKNLGVFSLKTLSEPLQNRVPRVQVLLPLSIKNPQKRLVIAAFEDFLYILVYTSVIERELY